MKQTFDVVIWNQGNHPPKEGREYLVTVKRGFVEILYYKSSNVWKRYSYETGYFTEDFNEDVVAWAELPEPYKETEE